MSLAARLNRSLIEQPAKTLGAIQVLVQAIILAALAPWASVAVIGSVEAVQGALFAVLSLLYTQPRAVAAGMELLDQAADDREAEIIDYLNNIARDARLDDGVTS